MLKVSEQIFKKNPHTPETNIPIELDYVNNMLIRNFLLYAVFRYTNPDEIKLNYRELFSTGAILNHYICPCGDTAERFDALIIYDLRLNKKIHKWLHETLRRF